MAFNINVGILGHVDSGKTTLARCLSNIASTAAFDKNPQSQERGITLDLGFSSFSIPTPEHLINKTDCDTLQYTLVDCPGHASLIKTIIGGAQIIDMMLLVVDIIKGIQTQTAECLIIGEITCKKMIVVLNKVDQIVEEKRNQIIDKMTSRIEKTLSTTGFANEDVPIISISALNKIGINELRDTIAKFSFIPIRNREGPLQLAIDHCFGIRGQGTVMTGTVLQGTVEINDEIDIPALGVTKKVKSMQMFRKRMSKASQGDRLGMCVTQFDPKSFERGIACSTGHGSFITYGVIKLNTIKYFKHRIQSKSKYHITIGYETILAQITLFYTSCNEISSQKFDFNLQYEYKDILNCDDQTGHYYILLEFEKPVFAFNRSLVIGSKLDMDINKNQCRLGFWGHLLESFKDKNQLSSLRIYKLKNKSGVVDRIVNDSTLIVKNLFKKETDLQRFLNLNVKLSSGEDGRIESAFGQSGKIKIYVPNGLQLSNMITNKLIVHLQFKRFIYDTDKKIHQ